jgi:hypothetical protein
LIVKTRLRLKKIKLRGQMASNQRKSNKILFKSSLRLNLMLKHKLKKPIVWLLRLNRIKKLKKLNKVLLWLRQSFSQKQKPSLKLKLSWRHMQLKKQSNKQSNLLLRRKSKKLRPMQPPKKLNRKMRPKLESNKLKKNH